MKILYILGSARCGSTILANILGELQGFFSAGEVRYTWERILQHRKCGCGRIVDQCEVWASVLQEVASENETFSSPHDVVRWEREALRLHHTPSILRAAKSAKTGDDTLARYISVMGSTYAALGHTTGARVLVDSSKRPSNGAILHSIPGVTPYYLHLVRDSRAVAYSRQQKKANPDREEGALDRRSLFDSAAHWTATNLVADLVRRSHSRSRSMLLRYEDFVNRPREAISAIVDFLDEQSASLPFLDGRTVVLNPNHTVSGNPDRFIRGPVELRTDDRWLRHMRHRDSLLTTALTFPFLLRYGYKFLVRPSGKPSAISPGAR